MKDMHSDSSIRKIISDFYNKNENKIKTFWAYPENGDLVVSVLKPSKDTNVKDLVSQLNDIKSKESIKVRFDTNLQEEDSLNNLRDKIQDIYKQYKDAIKNFWIYPTKDEIKIVKFEVEDKHKGKGIGAEIMAKVKLLAKNNNKSVEGSIKEQDTRTADVLKREIDVTKAKLREQVISLIQNYKSNIDVRTIIQRLPVDFQNLVKQNFALKGRVASNSSYATPNLTIIVSGNYNPTLILDLKLDIILDVDKIEFKNLSSRLRPLNQTA